VRAAEGYLTPAGLAALRLRLPSVAKGFVPAVPACVPVLAAVERRRLTLAAGRRGGIAACYGARGGEGTRLGVAASQACRRGPLRCVYVRDGGVSLPAKRWFQRAWLSAVLVATGLGMLVLSWSLPQSDSWWAGVLVEIGVTVMLLVPLLLLTGIVERQFRGVREAQAEIEATQAQTTVKIDQLAVDVAETREQVNRTREELAETMRARLSQRAAAEQAAVDALESNPSMQSTREALERATELGLIHEKGICIPVGKGMMLRFLPVPTEDPMSGWGVDQEFYPDTTLVCRLGWSDAPGEELFWQEDQPVEDFLEQLALRLRALDSYPGDVEFSKQAPLVALKEILGRALQANRDGSGSDLRGIALYMANGWTATRNCVFDVRDMERTRKGLYTIKQILDSPNTERAAVIEKHLDGIDRRQMLPLISAVSAMFHHQVLNPDEPPF
jgi:hypothetical protein